MDERPAERAEGPASKDPKTVSSTLLQGGDPQSSDGGTPDVNVKAGLSAVQTEAETSSKKQAG